MSDRISPVTETLEQCPICECTDTRMEDVVATGEWRVRCEKCGCQTCWWHSEQAARRAWNTRAAGLAQTPAEPTIPFPRWWVEKCCDQLRSLDPLPSGPLGDWVFQFRAISNDAVRGARPTAKTVPSREQIARIVDPTSWKMEDGFYVEQEHSDEALAKADAILALSQSATASVAKTPTTSNVEATVSRIMVIRNGMILDGDAEALIREEIGALMGGHAQRPTREAVEKALCCPKGCVRSDDCFVSGPPVRWSRSKHEREQADAILALCSPTVSDTSTDRAASACEADMYALWCDRCICHPSKCARKVSVTSPDREVGK
jgi:hypothetical protein